MPGRLRSTRPSSSTVQPIQLRMTSTRIPSPCACDVEVTKEGAAIWRRAMALRGSAEDDLATALTRKELATLNRLMKKLALHVESTKD